MEKPIKSLHDGCLASQTSRPRIIYGMSVWMMFFVLALCTTLIAAVLPGVERRRKLARTAARTILRFAGMHLTVKSLDLLPKTQCVVVANHASNLDGVVMTAALPPRFAFVIKREMSRVPLAGLLLRRLGSQFVERFNRNQGAADARRMMRNAVNGHSLAFFPEGTFSRVPGLLKFHTGAFVTAERAGCPVVPAVIRGTREALAPQTVWPQAAQIEVEIFAAIGDGKGMSSLELREAARQRILRELGEADLS